MNRLERIHTKEYCSAIKEQATNAHNRDDFLQHFAEWKDLHKYTLHDSIYMKFQTHLWKKNHQNGGDRTDWKGQAGTFWGDANVLQCDGPALHRCKVIYQNSSNGSVLELYLMVWVLKYLGGGSVLMSVTYFTCTPLKSGGEVLTGRGIQRQKCNFLK